jgi:hypothetical protein
MIVIMQKSLAISIEADMYDALQRVVGRGKISKFLQELARPHVMKEALEWSNGLIGDVAEADSAVWWNMVGWFRPSNRLQVVPLISNTGRVYPSEAVVTVAGKSSNAMVNQIATAAKERFKTRIGILTKADIKAVERAVKIQLGML